MIQDTRRRLRQRRRRWTLLLLLGGVLLAVGLYFLPPIHSRLAWRLEALRTRIQYLIHPPENVVFQPAQQGTLTPGAATQLSTQTATLTPLPDLPTAIPTLTLTPVPESVQLTVTTFVNQCNRWNYCGPANLTMAMNYWGWKGNRDDVAAVIKPGANNPSDDFIQRGVSDVNIMPYEMVDYVNDHTELAALYRYGGDVDLLRRMIAAGFPVIIEKGYYEKDSTGRTAWMGHYSFTTGYDEALDQFTWQNSYPNACDGEDPAAWTRNGKNARIDTADLLEGWRGFNYVFIVVYPPDRDADVKVVLGEWADWDWAAQHALETAQAEIATQSGNDEFFAWFNLGTSHVALLQYADAAPVYDQAFALYATLGGDDTDRPYRITWYQTGPFWAYYYSGRYTDVVNLADSNFETIALPKTLEESYYWRALGEYALGQYDAAYADMRQAVYYNRNFAAALAVMEQWGIMP